MVDAYLQPFGAEDMNIEILALFAREMDEARRDKRFKVPFQPLRRRSYTVKDDDDLLMDGAPLPFAIQRRTRAQDNDRSIGGYE